MSPIVAGLAATTAVVSTRAAGARLRRRGTRSLDGTRAAEPAWTPSAVLSCLEATDHPIPPDLAARWYVVALVVTPLLVGVASGPLLAVATAATVVLAPRVALPVLRRRRSIRRDDQLAPYLERVASTIRSGRSMRVAVTDTARAADRPLAIELGVVAEALDHGASLDDALAHWAAAPDASAEVRLAAAALHLGAQAGGEVARAVDGVAATLRERREVRGEVVALATQARMSAGLLVLAPLGFAGLVSTIEPGALRFLLGTPIGLACLVGGLGLDAVGGLWMQRIVRRPA